MGSSQFRGDVLEYLYLILGLVPALAWLAYFYRKDPYRPWSFDNIGRVFLWGCLCTVPAAIFEHLTQASVGPGSLWRSFGLSFLLIAPIEEGLKLLAVWVGIYRSADFREPIDGIVYSAAAAIGFATVENTVNMLLFGPGVIVERLVFATPAHVMFSSMWGYSMGKARFKREDELRTISRGLFWAICLHGSYNFVVSINPAAAKISLIPLMILMAWLMKRRVDRFRKESPFEPLGHGVVVPCPVCGAYALEEEGVCSRCGAALSYLGTDVPRFCANCRALLDPCKKTCPRCGHEISLAHLCPPA
ncbi:MAG: PrsW family glutamic-type intramembrane protease [Thermodesulfobacteriota bacterium]